MSIKRSVILRGDPEINEYGSATETIKPGYLVKGVTSVSKQTGTGVVPKAVALERDELGEGIDNSLQTSGTGSAFYASGDVVKVAVFDSGDEGILFVGSGQVVLEDSLLVSAGGGLVSVGTTPGDVIARSLETLNEVFVETAVRVQYI